MVHLDGLCPPHNIILPKSLAASRAIFRKLSVSGADAIKNQF
jgi:hypothetical protein